MANGRVCPESFYRRRGDQRICVAGRRSAAEEFAGLFGAAPSIALATVGMTIAEHGKEYAAIEARSMVLGAIAFCI
jgi:hypothetical protein